MDNVENLWWGRFTTLSTPLGKPALAGEQVSHIDHIHCYWVFSRRSGKKGRELRYLLKEKILRRKRGRCAITACL
jgi:hypothetical protein